MTDLQLKAIKERDTGDESTTMHSACGEYNCICHYERPTLLAEIDQLRKWLVYWRTRATGEGHDTDCDCYQCRPSHIYY